MEGLLHCEYHIYLENAPFSAHIVETSLKLVFGLPVCPIVWYPDPPDFCPKLTGGLYCDFLEVSRFSCVQTALILSFNSILVNGDFGNHWCIGFEGHVNFLEGNSLLKSIP
jgi:hypothetical protein